MTRRPSNRSLLLEERIRRIDDEAGMLRADIRDLERKLIKTAPRLLSGGANRQAHYRSRDRVAMVRPGASRPQLGKYLAAGSFRPLGDDSVSWPVRRNRRIFFGVISMLLLLALVRLFGGC